MYKDYLTVIVLRDSILTFDIANYQVDIEFSADGTIERSSYSCVNQHKKSKEDVMFLNYFNGRFGINMSLVYYEMFKADPKAVRIVVDYDNSFGVFHLLEPLETNLGKIVLAYNGSLNVDCMNLEMLSIELNNTFNFYSATLSIRTETVALFNLLFKERRSFSSDIKKAIKNMKKALANYDAKCVEEKCFVEKVTMLLSKMELCSEKESALLL